MVGGYRQRHRLLRGPQSKKGSSQCAVIVRVEGERRERTSSNIPGSLHDYCLRPTEALLGLEGQLGAGTRTCVRRGLSAIALPIECNGESRRA